MTILMEPTSTEAPGIFEDNAALNAGEESADDTELFVTDPPVGAATLNATEDESRRRRRDDP